MFKGEEGLKKERDKERYCPVYEQAIERFSSEHIIWEPTTWAQFYKDIGHPDYDITNVTSERQRSSLLESQTPLVATISSNSINQSIQMYL